MRVLEATTGAVVLAALSASAANAAWTRPSVLVTGDDAGLLDTVARPDGSLRAAIVDSRRGIAMGLVDGAGGASFGDPLVALRSPALVAQVALAADGSGVALEVQRDTPSRVVAFDVAGTSVPLMAIDDVGDNAALAISPAGTAVAAWVAKSEQGFAVEVAFRDPGAATFGAPVRAGYATTEHTLVSAGVGDSGEAVVAWQTNDRGQGFAVGVAAAGPGAVAAAWLAGPRRRGPAQVRVYGGDGRLRRIGTVGRNAIGENVEVAIAGAGATVVSWEEALRSKRGDPTARSHLAVAYRRPGGRLGAVRYFGPVSLDDSPESVQLGPAGRGWVLYEAFEPGDFGDRAGYRHVYVTERRP